MPSRALGRDEHRGYVEPITVVLLWQPGCHQLGIHELLRAQGLDGPKRGTLGLKVARLAVTFAWLGGDGQGDVTVPAQFFAGSAELLGPLGRKLLVADGEAG